MNPQAYYQQKMQKKILKATNPVAYQTMKAMKKMGGGVLGSAIGGALGGAFGGAGMLAGAVAGAALNPMAGMNPMVGLNPMAGVAPIATQFGGQAYGIQNNHVMNGPVPGVMGGMQNGLGMQGGFNQGMNGMQGGYNQGNQGMQGGMNAGHGQYDQGYDDY